MSFTIDPKLLGLVDEVALVTGGAWGIGKGCAVQLARAGCHVAIVDVDMDGARKTAAEIEALGRRATAIEADVTEEDQVNAMVEQTVATLGKLDVAVNNVGGTMGTRAFLDTDVEFWKAVIQRNLTSTFMCCQAEARAMIEGKTAGRIVNVSSSSGVVGAPSIIGYGTSKAGVIHMTKTMSMELAPHGLRINCIVPGTHDTERSSQPSPDPKMRAWREAAAKAPPLGRFGIPEEAGGLAVFFASRLSSYVTGHSLLSDGGVTHTVARPPLPASKP
jgi:NAD(P)-dependent dehydrogenase (short-subunit alcohol dehydrogenase family)